MHCPESFGVSYAPTVATTVIVMIFSEAWSVIPRALIIDVYLVLKGTSYFVNLDNWQWVFKYLMIQIIHIRS